MNCISEVELNGTSWTSIPVYAKLKANNLADTFLTLEIDEKVPVHDDFSDALQLSSIPFRRGQYELDTLMNSEWDTDAIFSIFEVEYGTAIQRYFPTLDKSSTIYLDGINHTSGEFNIRFSLILYPDRIPGGEVFNSTYPGIIHINGKANGIATFE